MTETWRSIPFQAGRLYRTLTAFKSLRDTFEANEILEFVKATYSAHDSYTGYVFKMPGKDILRVFDLHDDEPDSRCNEYFALKK